MPDVTQEDLLAAREADISAKGEVGQLETVYDEELDRWVPAKKDEAKYRKALAKREKTVAKKAELEEAFEEQAKRR